MSSGEQNEPMLLLTSPLGDDTLPVQVGTLHAVELHAVEEVSSPFEATLTVVSSERSIDPQELLYQSVGLTIRRPPARIGISTAWSGGWKPLGRRGGIDGCIGSRVVPRLWFLGQAEDSRIFQNMNAQEILQKIFNEHGIRPVDFRIYRNSPVREYTTQYNETDLAFVQRLMAGEWLVLLLRAHQDGAHACRHRRQ